MVARYYPRAGPYDGKTVSYRGFDPNRAGIAKVLAFLGGEHGGEHRLPSGEQKRKAG